MKKIKLLLSLLILINICYGQQDKALQLSSFVELTLKKIPQLAGVSVVVVNKDSILFAKGFGWADVGNKIPATAETGFYIASATKPFVAFVAAVLAEKGVLSLDKPITEYAPIRDFKDNSVFQNITIKDLLTHQSGIDNDFLSLPLAYSGVYTRESILQLLEENTTANNKGRAFEYSNFGYYLFSIILKEEFRLDWRELLPQYIFEPLSMQNSTAYVSKVSEKKMALPYYGIQSETPQLARLAKTDETMHAAGGMIASAHDVGKWLMFQLTNGMTENKQLYTEAMIVNTHTKQAEATHASFPIFNGSGYSLGWRLGTFKNSPAIYHFGGYTGFFSHLSFLPEKQLGVAVLVNHDMGYVPGTLIAEYAYALFLGDQEALKKHDVYLNKDIPALVKRRQESELKEKTKRAKRVWQLSLPKPAYAGIFSHPALGSVTIDYATDQLLFSYGNIKTISTPFPELDCMRIEAVPGSGSVIQFLVVENKVTGFRYEGVDFLRKD